MVGSLESRILPQGCSLRSRHPSDRGDGPFSGDRIRQQPDAIEVRRSRGLPYEATTFGVGQTGTSRGIVSGRLPRNRVGECPISGFFPPDRRPRFNPGNSGGALIYMNGHLIRHTTRQSIFTSRERLQGSALASQPNTHGARRSGRNRQIREKKLEKDNNRTALYANELKKYKRKKVITPDIAAKANRNKDNAPPVPLIYEMKLRIDGRAGESWPWRRRLVLSLNRADRSSIRYSATAIPPCNHRTWAKPPEHGRGWGASGRKVPLEITSGSRADVPPGARAPRPPPGGGPSVKAGHPVLGRQLYSTISRHLAGRLAASPHRVIGGVPRPPMSPTRHLPPGPDRYYGISPRAPESATITGASTHPPPSRFSSDTYLAGASSWRYRDSFSAGRPAAIPRLIKGSSANG